MKEEQMLNRTGIFSARTVVILLIVILVVFLYTKSTKHNEAVSHLQSRIEDSEEKYKEVNVVKLKCLDELRDTSNHVLKLKKKIESQQKMEVAFSDSQAKLTSLQIKYNNLQDEFSKAQEKAQADLQAGIEASEKKHKEENEMYDKKLKTLEQLNAAHGKLVNENMELKSKLEASEKKVASLEQSQIKASSKSDMKGKGKNDDNSAKFPASHQLNHPQPIKGDNNNNQAVGGMDLPGKKLPVQNLNNADNRDNSKDNAESNSNNNNNVMNNINRLVKPGVVQSDKFGDQQPLKGNVVDDTVLMKNKPGVLIPPQQAAGGKELHQQVGDSANELQLQHNKKLQQQIQPNLNVNPAQ